MENNEAENKEIKSLSQMLANAETIAQSPQELIKFLMIREQQNVLKSLREMLYRSRRTGQAHETVMFKTDLEMLFYRCESLIKRVDEKVYADLKENLLSDDYGKLLRAFRKINELLDQKQVTRVDIKQRIDRHRIEASNMMQGL